MIRLLIADDHKLVRDGLKQILAAAPGIDVAAEAANGDEALALVKAGEFDLALIDMSMPGLAGIALIKRLKLERPKLRILVLSMHGESQYAARALKAGASGYLTKDSAPEELVAAIDEARRGRRYVGRDLHDVPSHWSKKSGRLIHESLSDREYQILRMLGSGQTRSDIGRDLGLSPKTISTYRTRVLEKLGMRTNAELMRYAIENSLLES